MCGADVSLFWIYFKFNWFLSLYPIPHSQNSICGGTQESEILSFW